MHPSPKHEKKYIKAALKNKQLRKAVLKATETAVAGRQARVDETPYWEDLRYKVHALKRDVLDNLDTYLETFEARCKENGIQVHWALDATEAQDIILKLAKDRKVKKIVKAKSLTTEEIHLNEALIENDIETLETDLGEYIVQLEEMIPSHLTMPALHLSRQDIGKLFQEKLGIEYTEEPTELLTVAREKLREHFLTANMGISGSNFALAEDGAFVIIENEANIHLSITLPKVHVAVIGIEKLIPNLDALPHFLRVLGSSATGQKASSYVNIVGGPQKEKYGEGPEEVHIVLLDNGRSKILQDPKLRETLYCIRCGACLNICPVYQQIGGHAYGWVYMGPIGATLIPQYLGELEGKKAPFLSSLCGACYVNCPMRINIPEHLLTMRNRVVEAGHGLAAERWGMKIWAFLAKRPKLYRFATWFPGKLQQLLPGKMAFPAPGYTKDRALARFDSKGFRNRFYEEFED